MLESTNCCGVDEIAGLADTPEETLKDVCYEKYPLKNSNCWYDEEGEEQAFILITDTVKRGFDKKLVDYIRLNKLGVVIGTKPKKNPNSGNRIRAWLWSPNEKNLNKWFKSLLKKEKK